MKSQQEIKTFREWLTEYSKHGVHKTWAVHSGMVLDWVLERDKSDPMFIIAQTSDIETAITYRVWPKDEPSIP